HRAHLFGEGITIGAVGDPLEGEGGAFGDEGGDIDAAVAVDDGGDFEIFPGDGAEFFVGAHADHEGEVAAGGGTGDDDAGLVDVVFVGVIVEPLGGGQRVLDGSGGVGGLGGELAGGVAKAVFGVAHDEAVGEVA